MPETAVAPAAPAASTPAPAAAPAAPVSAPSSAPVSTPAAETPVAAPSSNGRPTSSLERGKFANENDYVAALLNEQMGAVPEVSDQPITEPEPVAEPEPTPEVPDAEKVTEPEAEKPVTEEDPEFDLNPDPVMTPEALTKMVTDNPEFGKLLESDPKLRGQLYKTTREAAELKPFKEIFADLDSAKEAVATVKTHNDIVQAFMGSTTKDGAKVTLQKIMELSYERDDEGNVVMQDGKPVVGDDFYGFVDNVVAMDLEDRRSEVQARLDANQYHVGAKTEQERDDAIARDRFRLANLDEMLGEVVENSAEIQELPEPLRKKAEELDRREREFNQKTHGTKVQERAAYEESIVTSTRERLRSNITSVISQAKKEGAVISPYLEKVLPDSIYAAVIQKIVADEGLKNRQLQLQRLPATEKSKTRRMAESDRAIQGYLPEIAIEQLTAAGIQLMNRSKEKAVKVEAQQARSNAAEPKGSTAPATRTPGNGPMDTGAAWATAEAEWKKSNPGRSVRDGQPDIIQRVLQLTLAASA